MSRAASYSLRLAGSFSVLYASLTCWNLLVISFRTPGLTPGSLSGWNCLARER